MLELDRDGAEYRPMVFAPRALEDLRAILDDGRQDRPGVRLFGCPGLAERLGPLTRIASDALGRPGRPVRAILFDKAANNNWSLGWHQDRTIAVRYRVDVDGFGPWTVKQGILHVAPPWAILQSMVTLRLHFDAVDADNAPLRIALGSHRLGCIGEAEVPQVVESLAVHACLAGAGDVWLYATPILHASDAARRPRNRRVLQIDYSADDLPDGLEWLGIEPNSLDQPNRLTSLVRTPRLA